jgi:hypothetical protein
LLCWIQHLGVHSAAPPGWPDGAAVPARATSSLEPKRLLCELAGATPSLTSCSSHATPGYQGKTGREGRQRYRGESRPMRKERRRGGENALERASDVGCSKYRPKFSASRQFFHLSLRNIFRIPRGSCHIGVCMVQSGTIY